jgi:ammonia channel protein AmtB
LQALIIGAVVPVIAYKLHYYVERRFRLDDAVGAVAVHGYSGFLGVVIAGFVLWGYPAAPLGEGSSPWFSTAEGLPMVNPLGNLLGAVIMFGVLGFLPAFALCKVLDRMGLLRVPRAVELAGLDTHDYGDAYPYFLEHETSFETLERTVASDLGPVTLPGSIAREDRSTVRQEEVR